MPTNAHRHRQRRVALPGSCGLLARFSAVPTSDWRDGGLLDSQHLAPCWNCCWSRSTSSVLDLWWCLRGELPTTSYSCAEEIAKIEQLGWTSSYDPSSLLSQAIDQDQPFVFVAVNYRVAGFGFMPGKEILANGSANLGLLDQRLGLEWVRIFARSSMSVNK